VLDSDIRKCHSLVDNHHASASVVLNSVIITLLDLVVYDMLEVCRGGSERHVGLQWRVHGKTATVYALMASALTAASAL
jgi:hypothetical protein